MPNTQNVKVPGPNQAVGPRQTKGLKRKDKEPEGWVAPNGTYMSPELLKAYERGVKNEKGDTIIFLPEFVEDPWEGMTPVLTNQEPRY